MDQIGPKDQIGPRPPYGGLEPREEKKLRREGEGVEEATIEVNSHLNLERVPRVAGLEDVLYKCNVGGRERLNCLRSLSRWAPRKPRHSFRHTKD